MPRLRHWNCRPPMVSQNRRTDFLRSVFLSKVFDLWQQQYLVRGQLLL